MCFYWICCTFPLTIMADKDSPTPMREDDALALWRERVKPAMMVHG